MNDYYQKPYDYRENEHQELFYEKADLTKEFEVNIPSPLIKLGYSFYILVKTDDLKSLDEISELKIDLDGLREDHEVMMLEEAVLNETVIPSSIDGYSWRLLCTFPLSRGNGPLKITGFPKNIEPVTLLITTWKRFVHSGEADKYVISQKDPKWAPSGMPLGGIGGGRIEICRDGRFRNFTMNNNQDAPIEDMFGVKGIYLSLESGNKKYDIATTAINEGHLTANDLSFTPDFPRASLSSKELGVKITLQGMFTPHNLKVSSIPGFIVKWELKNNTAGELNTKATLGWSNLIGLSGGVAEVESHIGYGDGFYHFFNDPTGRKETEIDTDTYSGISFTGTPDHLLGRGEHIIAVKKENAVSINLDINNELHRANITAEINIAAGEEKEIVMFVVTAMPNYVDTFGVNRGQYWQNNFNNAAEMVKYLTDNYASILNNGNELSVLLSDTSLPYWLRRRLTNCNYPLVTNSLFYKDGRFSINEGPTEMGGCMGTIDQRLGSHPTTQNFFPALNDKELTEFADIQGDNGGIRHDLGAGNLEQTKGDTHWPDLTCSFIIQTAKHAFLTGDEEFSRRMYTHAKKALLRHGIWADEGHGVAQVGDKLGTSYDGYHYIGTTGYMATLWIAALKIMKVWGGKVSDTSLFEQIDNWVNLAKERLIADLWNGEYFIAYGNDKGVRKESCHAGQIAGEYFSKMLSGENVLDEDMLLSISNALLKYNSSSNFIVPPDEVDPKTLEAAASFSWLPYIEAFMLSNLACLKRQEIIPVWEKMMTVVDRDGVGSNDTRLMYRPHKGEPSWGAAYMTAPAGWLVYEALLGFSYFKSSGELNLSPVKMNKKDIFAIIHPLFWALATENNDGSFTVNIKKIFAENILVKTINGISIEPIELSVGVNFTVQK